MDSDISTLTFELRSRGLAEKLGGWHFAMWNCDDLREAISLGNPAVPFPELKIDLCALLLQVSRYWSIQRTHSYVNAIRGRREAARKAAAAAAAAAENESLTSESDQQASRKRTHSEFEEAPQSIHIKRETHSPDTAPRATAHLPLLWRQPTLARDTLPPPANEHNRGFPRHARECAACTEEKPNADFPKVHATTTSTHQVFSLCTPCLTSYIGIERPIVELDKIQCPEYGCDQVISFDYMQQYAPPDVFARYDNLITQRALSDLTEYYQCANAACEYVFQGQADDVLYMVCEACNTKSCHICKTLWHPNFTHEENMARLAREDDERARKHEGEEQKSARTIGRMRIKICPNAKCDAKFTKDDGCDAVTCNECGFRFCWRCLAGYQSILDGTNLKHGPLCAWYG